LKKIPPGIEELFGFGVLNIFRINKKKPPIPMFSQSRGGFHEITDSFTRGYFDG